MQVVLLCAGVGSRMGQLTADCHKSLLPLKGPQGALELLLHEFNEMAISNVVLVAGYNAEQLQAVVSQYQLPIRVVVNQQYRADTNILSMLLALGELEVGSNVLVFEGDVVVDEIGMRRIFDAAVSANDHTVWFTRGRVMPDQVGGIVLVDACGNVSDVRIVDKLPTPIDPWQKMLGVMSIPERALGSLKSSLQRYASAGEDSYYLRPWVDSLIDYPSIAVDLSDCFVDTMNSPDDYWRIKQMYESSSTSCEYCVELLELDGLRPIEGVIPSRLDVVREQIEALGLWIQPVVVEREHLLVLDGMHRIEVARALGLARVPAVRIPYSKVEVWSLRQDQVVTREEVVRRALSGDIYPCKTAKHAFPRHMQQCRFELSELR